MLQEAQARAAAILFYALTSLAPPKPIRATRPTFAVALFFRRDIGSDLADRSWIDLRVERDGNIAAFKGGEIGVLPDARDLAALALRAGRAFVGDAVDRVAAHADLALRRR